jgi:hypothetical protein
MQSSNDQQAYAHEDEQRIPLLSHQSSLITVTGTAPIAEGNEGSRQRKQGATRSGSPKTETTTKGGVSRLPPPEGSGPASSMMLPVHTTSLNSKAGVAQTRKPNPEDILLGRGKPYQHHPGNEAMRRLVEQHKDNYNSLPRDKRGVVANMLMCQLQDVGARFLKRDDTVKNGGWEVAQGSEAYEKLCHALRAKASLKKKKTVDSTSSTGPKAGVGGVSVPTEGDASATMELYSSLVRRASSKRAPFLNSQPATESPSSTSSSSQTPHHSHHAGRIHHREDQLIRAVLLANIEPSSSASSSITQQPSSGGTRTDTHEEQDLAIRMALAKYLGTFNAEDIGKSKDKEGK